MSQPRIIPAVIVRKCKDCPDCNECEVKGDLYFNCTRTNATVSGYDIPAWCPLTVLGGEV